MPIFSLVEQLTHSSLHQMALYDLILKFTSLYKIFSIMSLISFYLRKFRIDFSQVGVRCNNNSVQCVPHDHFKKKSAHFYYKHLIIWSGIKKNLICRILLLVRPIHYIEAVITIPVFEFIFWRISR